MTIKKESVILSLVKYKTFVSDLIGYSKNIRKVSFRTLNLHRVVFDFKSAKYLVKIFARILIKNHERGINMKYTDQMAVKKPLFTTRSLVTMALFAAILCISAYISIPLPIPGSPHITMLNFVILLIALLFPMQQSVLIIFVWMLLGAIGLPVYIAGASGFGYLIAPWGGYTLTFLVVALILPLIRGKKYNRILYTIVSVAGVLIIDLFGMLWLRAFNASGYSWKVVFSIGFIAFLPLDLLKAVVVAQIIPAFRRILPTEGE